MTRFGNDARVPVTLLTGFLGAGKTTLLNHLIRDPAAGRVAIIMNEVGDIGLDHDLIEEATEETVLLQSGCLCCSILGDLAKTLGALIARRAAGKVNFDRVVVETSGIADPGPILQTMVIDRLVSMSYRMDGVVTLADAATGPRTLNTQFEAVHQVAVADLIILTKTDMVSAPDLAAFGARLETINGSARHMKAAHGRVPPGTLFGLSAMRQNVTSEDVMDWLGKDIPKPGLLEGLSGIAPRPAAPATLPATGTRVHGNHRIATASIAIEKPLPAGLFDRWLEDLIADKGADILRVKAIVHVQDRDWPMVMHGVQHVFDAPVPLKTWTGTDTTSRIVLIARDIAESELKASLKRLQAHSAGDPEDRETAILRANEMPF